MIDAIVEGRLKQPKTHRSVWERIRSALVSPQRPSLINYDSYSQWPECRKITPRYSTSAAVLAQGNVLMSRGVIHDAGYIDALRSEVLGYDFAR